MKTVAVFGAGVAGLTVAHELSQFGYKVIVCEANKQPGGFFRSARLSEHDGMPSEYSWHGLGPWYHNVFDLMKQIPFDENGSIYDKALSRPIDYGIAPEHIGPCFDESRIFSARKMFRMNPWDKIQWVWLLLKTWSSNARSTQRYSLLNASEQWGSGLSDLGWKTWRSCFGPWVGSDWTRVSLHHVGQFFRRNLMAGPTHRHPADEQGPAWTHGSGDGWLLLRGPSNEYWFDHWVRHLESRGVEFRWEASLDRLDYDGESIGGARLASGETVEAGVYVMAVNPFAAADIVERTPALVRLDQLCLLRPLVQDGPHTQVSFRIAFSERVQWPRERSALVIADSEFNLTLFATEQAWQEDVDLGEGVQSLWTGTSCTGVVPGRLYGLPVERCTKEQFMEEVLAQIASCEGLDYLLKKANGGRGFKDLSILRVEVWHEWLFSSEGIQPRQPKWVTSTTTQPYRPTQATPVANLLLAGAHTRTEADIWSIEGAVESGRRAARLIEPRVLVLPQYRPLWLRVLGAADDVCHAIGAPHFLNIVVFVLLASGIALMGFAVMRRPL